MFHQVLVVCTGNICRSPVAAAMLQQRFSHLSAPRFSSAGLGALTGRGVDPNARKLAEAAGLDVSQHEARQLDETLLVEADLVLVMSAGQRSEIGKRWPSALGKTMLLGHWLEGERGRDIPDPYRKSPEVFEHVHRLLLRATEAWAARL
ncbi:MULTISPECIES: low molecular weight protein-tyrosine-phosphatase [Halomonadaceae]|uniref:low molecular weight protein-tyrosine-phosphatase n=1 Tax=Halomonadaceae TaxID=28256 RepID=UPI00159857E3|nr:MULTISPECIES: low molecular weight protein-tyrosine-phosphatase [Halomonas]QJQ93999.1 low molecular weight phosphotyrosine protein phosphatase [Halomonas sp. PA5]